MALFSEVTSSLLLDPVSEAANRLIPVGAAGSTNKGTACVSGVEFTALVTPKNSDFTPGVNPADGVNVTKPLLALTETVSPGIVPDMFVNVSGSPSKSKAGRVKLVATLTGIEGGVIAVKNGGGSFVSGCTVT